MKKLTIAAGATLALALTGIGAGSAIASTLPTPSGLAAPNATSTANPSTDTGKPDGSTAADTEKPDASEPTSTESTVNDGSDGGHADPAGADVNHDGGPTEK